MLTNILAILLTAIVLGYCGWYLWHFVHYIVSGEYAVDQRFRDVAR